MGSSSSLALNAGVPTPYEYNQRAHLSLQPLHEGERAETGGCPVSHQ